MNSVKPTNIAAQTAYRARGNPVSTHPSAAISNFFPGLEFDLRSLFKHLFVGLELHEAGQLTAGHRVVSVAPDSPAAAVGIQPGDRFIAADGQQMERQIIDDSGPSPARAAIEFFNALADITRKAGQTVRCTVVSQQIGAAFDVDLEVRSIFDGAALSRDLLEAGAMTQGLCSPWQADYRECGCYYWAASRPDFINAEAGATPDLDRGHSWMQPNRGPNDAYLPDNAGDPNQITYSDLYRRWQDVLRFIVDGRDSE
jgi:hypothetical protein